MLKIKSIVINNIEEDCKYVNLIIGSNSSGKSTLLRELNFATESLYLEPNGKWLDSIILESRDTKKFLDEILPKIDLKTVDMMPDFSGPNFKTLTGFRLHKQNYQSNGNGLFNQNVIQEYRSLPEDEYLSFLVEKTAHESQTGKTNYYLTRMLASVNVAREFCADRLSAELQTTIQDVRAVEAHSIIHYLYRNAEELKLIHTAIKEAFGISIGFDNIRHGDKPLRILPDKLIRATNDVAADAERWYLESPLVSDAGDGIKAYLKIIFSLLDKTNSIVFIDEPEAFLHPPQRRRLGALVARLAAEYGKQVFISTHDAEFLRGAISNGNDVKVFNTKRSGTSRVIESVDLSDFKSLTTAQPTILNERVLNSFFYEKTIITEDESDRVFYEYVANSYHYQLVQNVKFVGLSGAARVVSLYEKMKSIHINVGMIVDVDFLLDHKYKPFYESPSAQVAHGEFKKAFNDNTLDRKKLKKHGRNYLDKIDKEILHKFEKALLEYQKVNIYIVPEGEMESWTNSSKNNIATMIDYVNTKRRTRLYTFMKQVLTI